MLIAFILTCVHVLVFIIECLIIPNLVTSRAEFILEIIEVAWL